MKLSDYVFKYLKEYGIEHAFMLSGGGAMYLDDSLGKSGIEYICNLHEQACAICAGAYAQYKGIGLAVLTTAPATTNAMTGVAACWLDSVPCLFISGQVKTSDMMFDSGVRQKGFQELNVVDLVKSITKYAVTVTNPSQIRYHLEKAIYLATHGRKAPVWLDIPLDVQSAEIDENMLGMFNKDDEHHGIDYKTASDALELLQKSERPVVILGNGARNCYHELINLFTKIRIPILTTWKAVDLLSENNELYCGRPGLVGQRGANIIQQKSDLIISLGARLDIGQIGYDQSSFAPNAKKIIIDIDKNELNKNKSDIYSQSNVKEWVEVLNNCNKKYSDWLKQCKSIYSKYPIEVEYSESVKPLDNYELIEWLSNITHGDDMICPSSSGAASEITMQSWKVKKGQRIINFLGLGSMGFGICTSIGACIASGKRVVCIEGDGSFAMNTQELETIRRLHLPIKIFVLNNNGYNSIRNTQNSYFNGHKVGCDPESGMILPSIRSIAGCYGIGYYRIECSLDFRVAQDWLASSNPTIFEVKIKQNQQTKPRVISHSVNGKMVQDNFENMFPYLDKNELKEIMNA